MDTSILNEKWRHFSFEKTLDFDSVMEHLFLNFFSDEPVQNYVGTSEDRRQDLDNRACGLLSIKGTICIVAIHTNVHKVSHIRYAIYFSSIKIALSKIVK